MWSDGYAILQSTMYYGLDRLEGMPIDEAIRVEDRPERQLAVSRGECEQLKPYLENPPKI